MENASKALIIAGAILLAIVIISLGLIVVNNVRDTADSTTMNEQEIQSFNAKFTAYEGSGVSGSRVNTLMQQVIATNQTTIDKGMKSFICVGYKPVTISGTGMTCFCINANNKVRMKSNIPTADLTGVKGTITIDTVNSKRTELMGKTDEADTKPTVVNTGKTYKVQLGYINGLVQNIAISEE